MEVRKITNGTVIQTFDLETGELLDSEFIADDTDPYENKYGNVITNKDILEKAEQLYHPFVLCG